MTSQRARLERTSDGLWVVGRFQESALEHIVQGIDSALSTVEAHYYPNDYRLDKTEWERWQAKREDIQRRAEGLKATEIKYMGPERRNE